MKRILLAMAVLAAIAATGHAVPFTAGSLAVLRAANNGSSNTTATIVELDKTTAGQTPSNLFAIPGTGVDAMRISGSATSTGYLSHTDDRSLLTFTAVNTADTTSNVNALNPRAVGTLNYTGTFTKQTTYTGSGTNQTRSATSLNNSTWYIGDQGGYYSNGTTTASPTGNIRSIKAFGGVVYSFNATSGIPAVSTISAATGGTQTGLPGLPSNANTQGQDFYLVQSGSNGLTYDILYTLSASSAMAGTVAKFSLVGGSWTANGTYTTAFGGFGMAAEQSGSGASLYLTTGTGATAANRVLRLSDTAGYNATINVVTANNVTLYTATGNETLKGIDFVAVAVPEASAVAFGGLACCVSGLAYSARRRLARRVPAS